MADGGLAVAAGQGSGRMDLSVDVVNGSFGEHRASGRATKDEPPCWGQGTKDQAEDGSPAGRGRLAGAFPASRMNAAPTGRQGRAKRCSVLPVLAPVLYSPSSGSEF